VEFLSIFRMSSPPAKRQSPPNENFLAPVLQESRTHLVLRQRISQMQKYMTAH